MVKFDVENPSESNLRAIDVYELLPQHEPFVMIGSLVHFDKTLTITETKVQHDNIFVDENRFSASGLMENIAQTCAARIGYVNKFILKKGIQLGFIGGVRNFEVIALPIVGDVITTRVEVKEDMSHLFLVNEAIDNNEIVSMPADRIVGSTKAVTSCFLGAPARFPIGPLSVATMKGLDVLAVNVVKVASKRYKVVATTLSYDKDTLRKEQMQELSDSYVAELERIVRRYPSQWFNFYDFWS